MVQLRPAVVKKLVLLEASVPKRSGQSLAVIASQKWQSFPTPAERCPAIGRSGNKGINGITKGCRENQEDGKQIWHYLWHLLNRER
jgi:hypothetical protein